MTTDPAPVARRTFLDHVERLGDRLPDPVFIFVWIIAALIAASVVCAAAGVSAVNPLDGQTLAAKSLLAPDNVRTLLVEMPRTLTGFAPLGFVLLVMMGAGLAERVGLLGAAIRGVVNATPRALLAPTVIVIGLISNHAADSGIVILPPLAAAAYAAAGRHPIAGLAVALSACIAGFAGNPFPGQFDALILGLTEPAARLIDPTWQVNLAGNWWFTLVGGLIFLPVGWFVADRIVEPRLGPWNPAGALMAAQETAQEHPLHRRGLLFAGLAALAIAGLWVAMAVVPGGPLSDPTQTGGARYTPFFRSLVAGFFLLFLVSGVIYGAMTGQIKSHRDVVRLTSESMAGMASYIVLALAAAHFIAMFNWSNLGAILAINGAEALKTSGLPIPVLLISITLMTAVLDIFIGSASAKWAALAPVLVPMLMLLGVSPEATTAAYRAGDSSVNMASPLMPYFALVLAFARRWQPSIGVGGLMAAVLPFSGAFILVAVALTGAWSLLELATGPGSPFHYAAPAGG